MTTSSAINTTSNTINNTTTTNTTYADTMQTGVLYGRRELVSTLKQLGIPYHCKDHSSVMTVDQLLEQVADMPGLHMKNLFLKNKKTKQLYLVAARHDAKVVICLSVAP